MTLIRESAELNRRERDKIEYLTPGSAVNYSLLSTGVIAGDSIKVINGGTATVTVLSSNASTIFAIPPSAEATFTALISSPTTAANWKRNAISGVIGDVTGVAVPAGYVGEVLTASVGNVGFSQAMNANQWYDLSLTLAVTPGIWAVTAYASGIGGSILQYCNVGVSLASGNVSPGTQGLDFSSIYPPTATVSSFITTMPVIIRTSASGTLYIKFMCGTAQGSGVLNGSAAIKAIRIA